MCKMLYTVLYFKPFLELWLFNVVKEVVIVHRGKYG